MSEITTLTIKMPLALKEKIKLSAQENQLSLSSEVCQRLESSFDPATKVSQEVTPPHYDEIDSQDTEEEIEQPLNQKELKKLRQLLKNGIKRGKKK